MAEDLQAHVPGDNELVCDVIEGKEGLQCQICNYVLENPQLLGCCGHHLCEKCVAQIKQSRISGVRSCPFCKAGSFTTMLNKGLLREINLLKVCCPNFGSGCAWEGQLNEAAKHAVGSGSQGECQYQNVKCRNPKCISTLLRKDLYHHEREFCKFRPYKCAYCLNFNGTYEVVSSQHFPVCAKFPVPCPNSCGCDLMPRASVQEHLSKQCPLQEEPCDYHSAGCNLVRARKNMKNHYQTCHLYHSSLLAKQNTTLQAQLAEMEQKLEDQESRFEALFHQHKDEQTALFQQQEANHKALLCQQAKYEKQVSLLTDRLAKVESKANNASSEVSQVSGKVKESSVAKDELRVKIAAVENKLASETNQMAGDLNSIKMDIFLLKDGQDHTVKLISSLSADNDRIEQVSKDCKKLEMDMKELRTKDVETAIVEQLSPTLSKLEELRDTVKATETSVSRVQQDVLYVEKCMTPQPSFPFTVSRFKERKFNKEVFVSPAFYTHPRGYKMCVRVDLYGMNNHVAVHCCVMRGEHDETLAWPFRGDIHICIENQLGNHARYEKVIIFDENTGANKSGRVTIGDKNYLHGLNQFISHQELGLDKDKNCQYLKGDALDFVVVKVDVKT